MKPLLACAAVLLLAVGNLLLGIFTAPEYTNGDFSDSSWWFKTWLAVAAVAVCLAYVIEKWPRRLAVLTVGPHIIYIFGGTQLGYSENDGLWIVGILIQVVLGALVSATTEGAVRLRKRRRAQT